MTSENIVSGECKSVKDAAKSNTKFSLRVPGEKTKNLIAVTKIRTIHARSDFAKLINDESVLYLNENKRKTKEWFQVRGNRVPLDGTGFGLIRSIQFGEENVKRGDEVYSKKSIVNEALSEESEKRRTTELERANKELAAENMRLERQLETNFYPRHPRGWRQAANYESIPDD